jgi:hypothetical protein
VRERFVEKGEKVVEKGDKSTFVVSLSTYSPKL